MNFGRSTRWDRILYPCLGHRILDANPGRGRHVPLFSWFYYASASWIAPRLMALFFIGLMPVLGLLLFGIDNQAVALGGLLASLIITGFFITGLLRPSLKVRSEVPPRVVAGEAFRLCYHVTNTGRLPAQDVDLDTLPFPYYLELRIRPAFLRYLASGSHTTVHGHAKALKRGRYLLQPLRWDTDFPFGLWRRGHTDWSHRTLLVYPAHTRLQHLDLPAGTEFRRETHEARHLTREAMEFHGCREFRAGDLVRHIHPRSSARLGVPVVKEFKAEARGRTAVVVDSWRQYPFMGGDAFRDPVLEAALSLTASVVDYLARNDRVLELLMAGPGLYQFESSGSGHYVEEVLDILADVEPCREDPLPLWSAMLLEEIREIQAVVLLLGRWDERRADFVRRLEATGCGLRVVMIEGGRRSRGPTIPPHVIRLHKNQILKGEVVSL